MGNPGSIRLGPSKAELTAEINRLRSHIHTLRATLRSSDARIKDLITRHTIPSHSDEALLRNNSAVLKQWETNTY